MEGRELSGWRIIWFEGWKSSGYREGYHLAGEDHLAGGKEII